MSLIEELKGDLKDFYQQGVLWIKQANERQVWKETFSHTQSVSQGANWKQLIVLEIELCCALIWVFIPITGHYPSVKHVCVLLIRDDLSDLDFFKGKNLEKLNIEETEVRDLEFLSQQRFLKMYLSVKVEIWHTHT